MIGSWLDDQTGRFPEIKNGGVRKENPKDGYVIFDQDNRCLNTMDSEAVRIARDFRQRLTWSIPRAMATGTIQPIPIFLSTGKVSINSVI